MERRWIKIDKTKLNSFIIAFSFFQFGILQLPATLINSQIIVAVSTIVLFLYLLLKNGLIIKLYVVYSFIFITSLFFISFLVNSEIVVILVYLEFLLKSFSLFLIGSFSYSGNHLYKNFKILSIINLISLTLVVLLGLVETISYMRFGYALLPTLLVSLIILLKKDTKIKSYGFWVITFLVSFILILIYGSRGPFVSFIILAILLILIDKNFSWIKKTVALIGIGLSYLIFVQFNILSKILNYIYYDMGFNTYSIAKFRQMLEDGLWNSSSGRDDIYTNILIQIYNKLLIGNGAAASEFLWGYTAHNFILQILLEFGIIGAFIALLFAIYFVYKVFIINKMNQHLFYVIIIIISCSIGRLFVSSDLWLRPEFWLVISMLMQKQNFKINTKSYEKDGTL